MQLSLIAPGVMEGVMSRNRRGYFVRLSPEAEVIVARLAQSEDLPEAAVIRLLAHDALRARGELPAPAITPVRPMKRAA